MLKHLLVGKGLHHSHKIDDYGKLETLILIKISNLSKQQSLHNKFYDHKVRAVDVLNFIIYYTQIMQNKVFVYAIAKIFASLTVINITVLLVRVYI